MKCQICNKEKVKSYTLAEGKGWFICEECTLDMLAQYYQMTNRELTNYLKWSERKK